MQNAVCIQAKRIHVFGRVVCGIFCLQCKKWKGVKNEL